MKTKSPFIAALLREKSTSDSYELTEALREPDMGLLVRDIVDGHDSELRGGDGWRPNPLEDREEIWSLFASAMMQGGLARLSYGAWLTRSPIEERFFYGLVAAASIMGSQFSVSRESTGPDGRVFVDERRIELGEVGLDYCQYTALPQHAHGKVHPDFTIRCATYAFLGGEHGAVKSEFVVELDGHDFHERTKEQASRDKKRDRDLAAIGLPVIRFTGSDIYKDPVKHALWTLRHANQLAVRPFVEAAMRKDFAATAEWYDGPRAGLLERDTGLDLAAWNKRLGIK